MTDQDGDLPAAFDDVARAIDGAEDAPPPPEGIDGDPSPAAPLGHSGGTYFFLSREGELRHLTARELVRLNIASLYGGDTDWLCRHFPVRNKKGDVIPGDFSSNKAAEWMMRACSRRGLFNPETPSRGLGVWRSREDVVAHIGGKIWHRGSLRAAGCVIGGAIYPARTALEEPDFANPASAYDCERLRLSLNAWAFTQAYDADLLFGFVGAALLGGFPHWRVHGLVTGERGSGKSTLGELIMNAIGAQGTSLNDYTEAGLRQTLTNEGRTLWLDEGESAGDEQGQRMAKVIGLLRKMSGGSGARIVRGTSGGQALNTTVTGCVLMTAINPPPLQPQDRSRILTVPIDKPGSARPLDDIRTFLAEARALSPRLRARALMGAERFSETFDVYRALLQGKGLDGRQADQYATLMAGRSLLLHDAVPQAESAALYVREVSARLHLIMLEDSDASDAALCLNRLMDASCEAIRDGIKQSIGQIVGDAMSGLSPENNKLMPLGLRIIDGKADGFTERMLFVANDHVGLRRIFFNTAWADGNWRSSLIRLPGVRPSPKPVAVGRKSRGLLVPSGLLPEADSGNSVDFSDGPAPHGGST